MTSFIDSVLRLSPQITAFDCDGTLWSGDVGEGFFHWEMKQDIVGHDVARAMRARYAEYRAGNVAEDQMCGEMATMHKGLPESAVLDAATQYFDNVFPGQIFLEMRELVRLLHEAGSEVWAVSSSNEWLIRAAMKHFGIPANRILAASVEVEDGMVTDRLIRVPSGPGKPEALREAVKKEIDVAFGNSRWDAEMLTMAKHAFAINPNPDLETIARQRGWIVYFPDSTRR